MDKQMIPGPRGLVPVGREDQPAGQPASPEEQKMYDEFVSVATIAMSNEKMLDRLMQMMSSAKPPEAIGKFAAAVAYRSYVAAKEKGVNLTGDVILNGGAEILAAAMEYAEAAGSPPLNEDQQATAMAIAADEFRLEMQKAGDIDEKALEEDIEVFRQAEQSPQAQQVLQQLGGAQPLPENMSGMQ